MNGKLKVAIFGGSGYGGSELLRILLFHPNAEIVLVTANEHAGKPVSEVHRNLNGLTNLIFEPAPEDLSVLSGTDVVFFTLPHGQALRLAAHRLELGRADVVGSVAIRSRSLRAARAAARYFSTRTSVRPTAPRGASRRRSARWTSER